MAVSDYPNGTAPHDALVLCEGMWVDPVLAPEILWVSKYCRDRGVSFKGNQGYRWIGNRSDYQVGYDDYIAGRDRSGDLEFGASQWYVAGVAAAGGPSAASIGFSNHGYGTAVDVASDGPDWQAIRDEGFRLMGWIRDVSGETWHYHKVRPRDSSIDLSGFAGDTLAALTPTATKHDPFDEENDMYVWTNQDLNRSYTVSRGTAKHHSNDSEKAIALKSIGGPDREIKLTDFEFATALVNAGMSLFVNPDFTLSRFNDPAWNGREIIAPSVDGGKFLAEWDAHYGIKR